MLLPNSRQKTALFARRILEDVKEHAPKTRSWEIFTRMNVLDDRLGHKALGKLMREGLIRMRSDGVFEEKQ